MFCKCSNVLSKETHSIWFDHRLATSSHHPPFCMLQHRECSQFAPTTCPMVSGYWMSLTFVRSTFFMHCFFRFNVSWICWILYPFQSNSDDLRTSVIYSRFCRLSLALVCHSWWLQFPGNDRAWMGLIGMPLRRNFQHHSNIYLF